MLEEEEEEESSQENLAVSNAGKRWEQREFPTGPSTLRVECSGLYTTPNTLVNTGNINENSFVSFTAADGFHRSA